MGTGRRGRGSAGYQIVVSSRRPGRAGPPPPPGVARAWSTNTTVSVPTSYAGRAAVGDELEHEARARLRRAAAAGRLAQPGGVIRAPYGRALRGFRRASCGY